MLSVLARVLLGKRALCRNGHSSSLIAGDIWIFGGWDDSSGLNDMWKYSIQAGRWRLIPAFYFCQGSDDVSYHRRNRHSVASRCLARSGRAGAGPVFRDPDPGLHLAAGTPLSRMPLGGSSFSSAGSLMMTARSSTTCGSSRSRPE